MNKLNTLRTLVLAIILTSTAALMGQQANAQEYSEKGGMNVVAESKIVALASKRLKAGRLDVAKRLYRKALKKTLSKSDRFIAYNDMCALHNIEKKYKKALGYCNKALKIIPANWLALKNRGESHLSLGNYKQAQEDFSLALTTNPGDRQLIINNQLAQSQSIRATNR